MDKNKKPIYVTISGFFKYLSLINALVSMFILVLWAVKGTPPKLFFTGFWGLMFVLHEYKDYVSYGKAHEYIKKKYSKQNGKRKGDQNESINKNHKHN